MSPDNGLELQLPASTKVVAVATPAGKEKQAKKKTAAARAAAQRSLRRSRGRE